jgi:aminopeptidase N
VLLLPSEAYVAECVGSDINPQRIHHLREQMRAQIAAALRDDWAWAFDTHQVRSGYQPSPAQASALLQLLTESLAYYEANPAEATTLLQSANATAPPTPTAGLMIVCRALFSSEEFLRSW